MQENPVSVRVPGKVMVAGEYSVLVGGRALALTINKGMTFTVSNRSQGLRVVSDFFPEGFLEMDMIAAKNSMQPCIQAAYHACRLFNLPGLQVVITSELCVSFGMGSSSAIRLGILKGAWLLAENDDFLSEYPNQLIDWEIAEEAWKLQRSQQKAASGYDVATQLKGGPLVFSYQDDCWPILARKLEDPWWLKFVHVFVGGRGAPTGPVLHSTRSWLLDQGVFQDFCRECEALVDIFMAPRPLSLTLEDSMKLLCIQVRKVRQMTEFSPRFPRGILSVLEKLPQFDSQWSIKTTGAGGEDAFLLVGTRKQAKLVDSCLQSSGWQLFTCQWVREGLRIVSGPAAIL